MPSFSIPTLPSSVLSLIIPMWPFSRWSHRSLTLVGALPSALVADGEYAIPVKPDCHVTVYVFPGSYGGSVTSGLAYVAKFGSLEWSSGMSQPFAISSDSCAPFVITIRSQPVGLPASSEGLIVAKNAALSLITGRYSTWMPVCSVNRSSDG